MSPKLIIENIICNERNQDNITVSINKATEFMIK